MSDDWDDWDDWGDCDAMWDMWTRYAGQTIRPARLAPHWSLPAQLGYK